MAKVMQHTAEKFAKLVKQRSDVKRTFNMGWTLEDVEYLLLDFTVNLFDQPVEYSLMNGTYEYIKRLNQINRTIEASTPEEVAV